MHRAFAGGKFSRTVLRDEIHEGDDDLGRPRLLLQALAAGVPVIASPACVLEPRSGLTIVPARRCRSALCRPGRRRSRGNEKNGPRIAAGKRSSKPDTGAEPRYGAGCCADRPYVRRIDLALNAEASFEDADSGRSNRIIRVGDGCMRAAERNRAVDFRDGTVVFDKQAYHLKNGHLLRPTKRIRCCGFRSIARLRLHRRVPGGTGAGVRPRPRLRRDRLFQ
jgi:hypothetical protein